MLGVKLLTDWDYGMEKDSIGASVFASFEFYYATTFGEKLE